MSYTLGGDDAAAFDIAADGTVTFNVTPDYEVDPQSYSFTVTADDGNGGTATQSVTVNVADVTEVTYDTGDLTFNGGADTVDPTCRFEVVSERHCHGDGGGRFKPSDAVCDEDTVLIRGLVLSSSTRTRRQ